MKRLIALLLAMLMILSLAACAGSEGGSSRRKSKKEDKTEEKTEDKIVFEETTLVDNDECTVKITSIDPESDWGYTLNVYLENKSESTTYMFSLADAAVNGVEWDPYFAEEIAPGKVANKEINFYDETLEELLPVFTDIELEFRIYDSEDWAADDLVRETFHIYPLGEDKAEQYVYEPQSTDTVVVDNDKFSVIVTGYDEEGFLGYTTKLVLVNKTDTTLGFDADDVSVNDSMCDPYWGKTLAAGKTCFTSMAWSDSDLEENEITEVEKIEMTFTVRNYDDYYEDPYFNETVTLTP